MPKALVVLSGEKAVIELRLLRNEKKKADQPERASDESPGTDRPLLNSALIQSSLPDLSQIVKTCLFSQRPSSLNHIPELLLCVKILGVQGPLSGCPHAMARARFARACCMGF